MLKGSESLSIRRNVMDQCCDLCGAKLPLLSKRKAKDGVICGACASKIPRILYKTLPEYKIKALKEIAAYETRMRGSAFVSTAHCGKLHLDEIHGLIAICDKSDSDGKLIGTADVFECIYLDSIGLYAIEPRQIKQDIVCDIEFACAIKYPELNFRTSVKREVKCDFKRENKTQVIWSEPGTISVFRNMLNQTIQTAVDRAIKARTPTVRPYDLDMMVARAVFHVGEGYSKEQIERQYQNMVKMYRSAYSDEEANQAIPMLTKYYQLLRNGLDPHNG